jgi:hypothetical protein
LVRQVLESAGRLTDALALLSEGQKFDAATELVKRHPLQEGVDFTRERIDEFAKEVFTRHQFTQTPLLSCIHH